MDELARIFEQLTPAQADVIASGTTLFSALLVAIVAPITFHILTRKGVRGFEQSVKALQRSANRAEHQAAGVGDSIGAIRRSVGELEVLVSSLQEGVANTQNALIENAPAAAAIADGAQDSNRERIKLLWRSLQDGVEQAASDPEINGNTRARYARIDRRGYLNLVAVLIEDGRLGGAVDQWREAYFLWNAARYASTPLADADLTRMQTLAAILQGAQQAHRATRLALQSALKRSAPRGEIRKAAPPPHAAGDEQGEAPRP